jgi:hypothetical protein
MSKVWKNKRRRIKNFVMNKLYKIYSHMVLAWIFAALSIQSYFVYLHFTRQDVKAKEIAAKISKQPW